MKITLRDVAKAAGVSPMAVSYVLHGTGKNVRVSAETAEKIRRAAADLQYSPNLSARSLKTGRTRTVGVVFQRFSRITPDNPYVPQLLNGIMAALFPADYTLALCPRLVQHGEVMALGDGRFDGILWARPDFTEATVEFIRNVNVPIVMLHAPEGAAPGVQTYCADNREAMRLALKYLFDLGHRNAFFVIDAAIEHAAESRERGEAFLAAVQELGMVGDIFPWDERAQSLAEYLAAHPSRTAACCFSDTTAGRMLRACEALGINVPRALSVIGFDSSPFCEQTQPRLTSIYQPVERIAFEATKGLLELIEQGPKVAVHSSTLYPCGLDVRDSTWEPSTKKTS